MTEIQPIPKEVQRAAQQAAEAARKKARKQQAQAEDESQSNPGVVEFMQQMQEGLRRQAELDPAFARKVNEIAVSATVALEKLVDYQKLWQGASLGEKLKLTPGIARNLALVAAGKYLTGVVMGNVTDTAIKQASAEGFLSPEQVKGIWQNFRAQGWVLDNPPPVEPTPVAPVAPTPLPTPKP